ncbi:MAG: dihydrolipoyl dehydrogenase [Elusimicrobiota bacterium]|nr:dihydrolipoyl dehydrogenase [Elusimicrobiota bacterium]
MRRLERVEVAIVGAGSAGLAALGEARKAAKSFVLIDEGPLGTTCARVGCMPSKALIQAANEFHRASRARGRGLRGGGKLRLDIPEALAWVRKLRDGFTEGPILAAEGLGRRLIRGRARFAGPNLLRVGERTFLAERVILATGSRPVVPEEFLALGAKVVTTDTLFDLKDLPARIGVIGLGSIGLEIGQALSRLGCDVMAFDRSRGVGNLTDPAVNACALREFSREFRIRLGVEVRLVARGGKIEVRTGGRAYVRDLILASLGRRPNLDGLGLESIGVRLDERGLPPLEEGTLKVRGRPIYLAGDASALRPLLHEAVDDGRIAGFNAVRRRPRTFGRRAPLSITFSEPNLALVGSPRAGLKRGGFVTGAASFETDARSLILGENRGLLHVYARALDGRFLGAEMAGPAGEHLGHLMAWALQRGLSVDEMLALPFYHPSVEEGLRTALRDAARKLKRRLGNTTLL